jgi:hypothetical protein
MISETTSPERKIKAIETSGIASRGRREMLKHLRGQKIGLKAAVLAKCYECMGYYADGRSDCKCLNCPLYPFNPVGAAWKERERRPHKVNSAVTISNKQRKRENQNIEKVSA